MSDQTPTRPPTRGELILRGFMQGGALAILAGAVLAAHYHLGDLTQILKACAVSP